MASRNSTVAPGTADVFGRTASRDVDQARVCDARHGIGDALDFDRVLPAIAEVVEIFEGLHADVFENIDEAGLARVEGGTAPSGAGTPHPASPARIS